jgi:lipopolysaccharide transport system ATP-binding protein
MTSKDIAIKVENISKIYRIGTKDELHDTFAKAIVGFLKRPLKNYRKYRSLYNFNDIQPDQINNAKDVPSDIIWAVKDVSFDVLRGEVLGIIGRNGAGKSTLLKILCKITNPTSGYAKIHGRVSSLLEVGTGFHKELTGRENIYLNGTILGMRKKEVDLKFDEILEFSGVEQFIDTPVKRYSSGMTVRLAFSVAAHLDPEILIIDEVLAVGDAEFQRKCLNKMEDVGQQGRTVLFVSHNMPAVSRLCSRVLLLENGAVIKNGATDKVVNAYLTSGRDTTAAKEWPDSTKAPGGNAVRLHNIKVLNANGIVTEHYDIREPIIIQMEYEVLNAGSILLPNLYLWNSSEVCVLGSIDNDRDWRGRPRPVGTYTSSVQIPGNFLADGMHYVNAAIETLKPSVVQFYERNVIAFQVIDRSGDDTDRGDWTGDMGGVVRPFLHWETKFISN